MPTVTLTTPEGSTTYAMADGETVLESLERQGVAVPNSCRAGACQSCLMQASDGALPPDSQKGLKESLRARGYFLACMCRPAGNLTVHPAEHAARRARAIVRRVERLSHDVARVLLACDEPFEYFPGQFVNLVRSDGLVRSYSLANLRRRCETNGDELLELHVRRVENGRMSNWLCGEVQSGESLEVRGPQGDCFYVSGQPEQPILLVGTGTGLAPLYAIARDALQQGHTAPIRLYHGARDKAGLYFVDELLRLSAEHANFSYIRSVTSGDEEPGLRIGPLDRIVLGDTRSFAGWRVFLCGNPELVQLLRKKIFLAGAKMNDIYSDAFIMAKS